MRTRAHVFCPDQSARGLAQSKTLARMAPALVNAKRLGLRWSATAFPPRRGSSTFFRKQNRYKVLLFASFVFSCGCRVLGILIGSLGGAPGGVPTKTRRLSPARWALLMDGVVQ
jgi:hypothetical protein